MTKTITNIASRKLFANQAVWNNFAHLYCEDTGDYEGQTEESRAGAADE